MEYDIKNKQQGYPVLTPSGFVWALAGGFPLASPRRFAAQKQVTRGRFGYRKGQIECEA